MVSLAIIGLLATISFYSAFQNETDSNVHNSLELVRSSAELARTNASVGLSCCGGVNPVGYGVYAIMDGEPDQEFFIYADIDGDYRYTAAADQVVGNRGLLDNVTFQACDDTVTTITPQATPPNTCDINFSASTLYFNGSDAGGKVTITVRHTTVTSDTDTFYVYPHTLLIE